MGPPSLINGVAWSLEVEVQFYSRARLSLVFCSGSDPRAARRSPLRGRPAHARNKRWASLKIPPHIASTSWPAFSCAIFTSTVGSETCQRVGGGISRALLAAAFPMGAAHRLAADGLGRRSVYSHCATAAISRRILAKVLGNPWPATICGMCYTIYRYHGFLTPSPGDYLALAADASIRFPSWSSFSLITSIGPRPAAACVPGFFVQRPFTVSRMPCSHGHRAKVRTALPSFCVNKEAGTNISRFNDSHAALQPLPRMSSIEFRSYESNLAQVPIRIL